MSPAAAQTAGSGYGWDQLEQRVDRKIVKDMEENAIAGMTVAISKDGRLILSKGYGGRSSPFGTDMRHDTRTRLGSTSKPLVTGPTGVELLARLGIDPATKRLYGPGGVLPEQGIAADQAYGANRQSPVVATAVDRDDQVYTWPLDGTFVVGTSFDLSQHRGRQPYELPDRKNPADIVDVAIDEQGSAITDGTMARGSRIPVRSSSIPTRSGRTASRRFPAAGRS